MQKQLKVKRAPLVSVIIPVYNTGSYVRHILEAVKKQTYTNIELIVVDDGSTDNSIDVIENTMTNSNMNWTLIKLANGGVSRARNKGIEYAKGEWIFCPDSDDWISPQTIEYLLNSAVNNDAQCAFCEYKNVDGSSITKGNRYDKGIEVLTQKEFEIHNILRKSSVVIPGMIISRSAFSNIRFDELCPYSEDTLYTWELIYQIKKVVWVKCDLYNYFTRQSSKQHSLTVEKCLTSIERYSIMTSKLIKQNPSDNIVRMIQPKFVLASMHVLARCNNYERFQSVYKRTTKADISLLYKLKDIKLTVFGILYIYAPYIFYRIARVR